ncbi:MAG: alpha/beta hydrolase [Burkholderiaceae bacterium]|jgi:predicted alpha/beta hydrolase family esterase
MEFINLPGIGGSGPEHWQTLWEGADRAFNRFHPSDWDRPDLDDWQRALDAAVCAAEGPVTLVAHSLSCLLVAHWAVRAVRPIRGAFLVCVPDPTTAIFPSEAASFGHRPTGPLPFPTLIVASADDPYSSLSYARTCASQWRAGLIELGPLGHINAASQLGDWSLGRMLLGAFTAGLVRPSSPDTLLASA